MDDNFRDSKVHPKLRRQVWDLDVAIDLLLQQEPRFAIPALILLYAGIDAMAWVAISDGRMDVQGADFKLWTETYLLPDSNLECTTDDLWAARCGMVHAQLMDSRHARQDKARHFWYYVGPKNRYLIPMSEGGQKKPLTLHIDVLVQAFKLSTKRFFDAIENDPALRALVWPRAERYYDEVSVHGEPGTEGSWVQTIPTVYK